MHQRSEPDPTRFIPPRQGLSRLKSPLRALANVVGAVGMTALTGGYAFFRATVDIEFTQHPMPLRGLGREFDGFRLAHLADFHTGRSTRVPYLRSVMQKVRDLKPDLVCMTGDLVTHRREEVPIAIDLLASISAPVLVVFGNHDYELAGQPWLGSGLADEQEQALSRAGMTVLRNRSTQITRGSSRLTFVGVEDWWSTLMDLDAAFASLDPAAPIIALSHNPDTAPWLARRGAQWILSGHTHGGQMNLPLIGSPTLPIRNKSFAQGLVPIRPDLGAGRGPEPAAHLYVSRGVGVKLPVRFRCRPEVAMFTLCAST